MRIVKIINEEINSLIRESSYDNVVYKGDVPNSIDFTNYDKPSFFTTDKSSAELYTQSRKEQGGDQNNTTIKANVSLKNPLIINSEQAGAQNLITPDGNNLGTLGKGDWLNNVKSNGYDGIVINKLFGTPLNGWEVIAFNGNQINIIEPIKEIIENEINSLINEEYADNLLYGYHVTFKDNVESVFKNGLKVGGASMQGSGLYAFYHLDYEGNAGDAQYYATKTYKDTAIIKFSVHPMHILIFNPEIAKEVLGDKYLISDQIKSFSFSGERVIEQSAKINNMSIEEFEKMINTKFLNNERNWHMSGDLVGEYQDLGIGRLFDGEYGLTYVIRVPSRLNLIGYYDMMYDGQHEFSDELKVIRNTNILDIINNDDKYANLEKHLNINQLESVNDINRMIKQLEENQMNVRNNREYKLIGDLIDSLGELEKDYYNQSTDTTDYSKVRGIS